MCVYVCVSFCWVLRICVCLFVRYLAASVFVGVCVCVGRCVCVSMCVCVYLLGMVVSLL